jgi:hypothetical protein
MTFRPCFGYLLSRGICTVSGCWRVGKAPASWSDMNPGFVPTRTSKATWSWWALDTEGKLRGYLVIHRETIRQSSIPVTPEPIPRPCKRFSKRACLNERFLKHLPICSACRAVVLYLDKQSQIDKYVSECSKVLQVIENFEVGSTRRVRTYSLSANSR